jgi:ABC-2 type transport system ATP-binding protein
MDETTLRLNKLSKKYGSHTVLEFDHWEVNQGIYLIKGINGAGKTTLFKIISGQVPFNGEAALNNITLNKQPETYRAMLSYAEAEPQYPAFITGNELLEFHLHIRKAERKSADELIEGFKMGDYMKNKIESYSSGMLKKLSLICAFTGNVKLYILDELMITIDQPSIEVLYILIKKQLQEGKIFLISSHQELDSTKVPMNGIFQIENQQLKLC